MSLSVRMAEAIPRARHHWVPGGTHLAPLEDPERVWREVESFLDEALSGAKADPPRSAAES